MNDQEGANAQHQPLYRRFYIKSITYTRQSVHTSEHTYNRLVECRCILFLYSRHCLNNLRICCRDHLECPSCYLVRDECDCHKLTSNSSGARSANTCGSSPSPTKLPR